MSSSDHSISQYIIQNLYILNSELVLLVKYMTKRGKLYDKGIRIKREEINGCFEKVGINSKTTLENIISPAFSNGLKFRIFIVLIINYAIFA